MITKSIDDNAVSVIAEDADDLLNLRRAIKAGDKIIGDTRRVIKQDREYSRPDRGERIKIRVSLQIQKISLDNVVDRLRVAGTILESSNEAVPHGSHHSMVIVPAEPFTLVKKKWSDIERGLVSQKTQKAGFVLVAVDTTDCGIGRIYGTHLNIMPNMYSGASGKRYKTSFDIKRFFEEIHTVLSSVTQKGDNVLVFGPGETKKRFVNYIQKTAGKSSEIQLVEGIDSGGEDGIYTFTKSDAMRETMANSKMAKIADIVDDVMSMAGRKGKRFTMGFDETSIANRYGAIQSLVFSDRLLEEGDEQDMINFLNDVESKGAQVFSVDASTDLGLRVTGLGGVISTLRFAVQD